MTVFSAPASLNRVLMDLACMTIAPMLSNISHEISYRWASSKAFGPIMRQLRSNGDIQHAVSDGSRPDQRPSSSLFPCAEGGEDWQEWKDSTPRPTVLEPA
jgi:hypothetical protein